MTVLSQSFKSLRAALCVAFLLAACGVPRDANRAVILFSRIPQADAGGGDKQDVIEGVVRNAGTNERLVLYAKSGDWWLQPLPERPFVRIQRKAKWVSATHLGSDYAALLVKPEYSPPPRMTELPATGNLISAVASVHGAAQPPSKTIPFSGYEWRVRSARSNRGGRDNLYAPENAWTDDRGRLHLRIARTGANWTCAEVSLTRSLGYGTYSFTVDDSAALDPASVFGLFTWDYSQPDQNFGELDIDFTRRGDPSVTKNLQYSIQPHYVTPNLVRFPAPSSRLTHSFRWAPGRIAFRTARPGVTGGAVAEHAFTSGVPTPGIESVRMALYVYGFPKVPFSRASELIVERFEYSP